MRSIARLVVVIALGGCASSDKSEHATAAQCERVKDHLVELRLSGTQADMRAHGDAIKEALGSRFTDQCIATVDRGQIDCALAAKDAPSALSCIQQTSKQNQ
jgi:hypothetical protein